MDVYAKRYSPNFGVNQQYLEDGDVVVFHYTDNYYYEESSPDYEKVKSSTRMR